jgi:hypothetical protein
MAESIVYEHPNFKYDQNNINNIKLVKWKDQVISVESKLKSYYITNCQKILIKNLTTQKNQIEFLINTDQRKLNMEIDESVHLYDPSVFMYTDSILWIGYKCNYHTVGDYYYNIWLVDLETSNIIKSWSIDWIGKVIPIGQQYFQIELRENLAENYEQLNIYEWHKLVELDKPIEPVYQINKNFQLYSINWSSSSIGLLCSCEFILVSSGSEQMNFLNKNFCKILSLNVKDLFPDYKQYPVSIKKYCVNANCLIFHEYLYSMNLYNLSGTSSTKTFCWDFTTNSPVKFTYNDLETIITNVIPFRINPTLTTSKLKFFITESCKKINYTLYKVCESE